MVEDSMTMTRREEERIGSIIQGTYRAGPPERTWLFGVTPGGFSVRIRF